MHVKKLTLSDFRNYASARVDFSEGTNIIYGDNAQGKTNLLEAVYLFSQGRSARAKFDREMIRFGADAATLMLEFEDSEREYKILIRLLKNGKKLIKINNVQVNRLSRLMSCFNAVMFSPEDLGLVKGAPGMRRKFLDSAISQLYPSYLSGLAEYHKILAQKNSLLKQMAKTGRTSDPTMEIWNEAMAKSGIGLMKARRSFTLKCGEFAAKVHKEISAEELRLEYAPNSEAETAEELYEIFCRGLEREVRMGAAQYGIQRDDIRVMIDGKNAAFYGSQGQQRTAVLSMKLAQADCIYEIRGEQPVMLLDDIMSELDKGRRAYLAERIRGKQVIITCTDREDVADTGRLYYVKGGTVKER